MAEERRQRPRPATVAGFLDQLPAVALLNRISIPMLADDGVIMFANPACQAMLGAGETTITGQPLNRFLHVPAAGASDSVAALREAAGQITTWQHAHDATVESGGLPTAADGRRGPDTARRFDRRHRMAVDHRARRTSLASMKCVGLQQDISHR
jgi:PAS domain-containing protein